MGNIKIVKGVFDSSLELVHAEVAAGFPDITVDYAHETLDFNRDYIKHPEASFYGDVKGDSMKDVYNGGTVLLLYYSGYTHATILLRYLSALLDKF